MNDTATLLVTAVPNPDEMDAVIATLFDSAEHAALVPARDRGVTEMNILVTQPL